MITDAIHTNGEVTANGLVQYGSHDRSDTGDPVLGLQVVHGLSFYVVVV